MSRYFLYIRRRDTIIIDEEGISRPNLVMVLREALAAARDMIADDVRSGRIYLDQTIVIYDDAGSVLGEVHFAAALSFANSDSVRSRAWPALGDIAPVPHFAGNYN